jgi:hypothetical protein
LKSKNPIGFRAKAESSRDDRLLYALVLAYIVLWIFEGGLRRWILPQLSNPLLVIRDPVAILIYGVAMWKRQFPFNGIVIAAWALAILELVLVPMGHGNPIVAAYGIRCDFLHVPMIFIIGNVLTSQRLMTLCRVALVLSVPFTMLLVTQFYSPQSAWVNRGLGGSLDGAGFDGAGGYFRPPGTFSFINGPMALYPILAACFFLVFYDAKDLSSKALSFASAGAILLAIPISISRGLFIGVLLVAVTGVAVGLLRSNIRITQQLTVLTLIAVFLLPVALQSQSVQDGIGAFTERWTASTTDQGGIQVALVDRVYDGTIGVMLNPSMEPFGAGTGFSTNVGQLLTSGERGFGGSEGELGRLMYDNGFAGLLVIVFRVALTFSIGYAAYCGLFMKDQYALIFFAAAFPMLITGQWAQPTSQGAATIAAGLVLAASKPQSDKQRKVKKKKRFRRKHFDARANFGGMGQYSRPQESESLTISS